MIELIRLVLPYLLILYFVVKGIKEPLYFLGIPFLMFMSNSIFFDGVKLFNILGKWDSILIFIWLVFLWILPMLVRIYTGKNEISNIRRLNVMDYCIIGLMLISFVGLGMTIINYSLLTNVFKEFLNLISLFACYFIIKNWSSHNKPEVLVKFLFSLLIINSIASFLYILHQGLHFNIYPSMEYSTEFFQGVEITRTFWFMPQFLAFSIAYILVFKEKKSFVFSVLLIVNLLAIIISYTRSLVINAAIIFLFYFILTGLKKGRLGLVFKNIFIYGVLGVLGIIMLSKLLPANTKYLMNRFAEIKESKSYYEEPDNLEVRFINTGIIISNIDGTKKMLGMGSVSEKQLPWVTDMKQTTADMVWTGVIFRWGIVGLILFILLYFFSIISAFNFYMKSEGVLSDLALLFLLYIISQIIESFVSWTFMSGHGFAIGLWYFAMLSALVGFNKNKGLSNE